MNTLIIAQYVIFFSLLLITSLLSFGTKYWFWNQKLFSSLKANNDKLLTSFVNVTHLKNMRVEKLAKHKDCGKKIVVTTFIYVQINNFAENLWEDWLKYSLSSLFVSLITVLINIKSVDKDVSFHDLFEIMINSSLLGLSSIGLVVFAFKLNFEYWLLRSQAKQYKDIFIDA